MSDSSSGAEQSTVEAQQQPCKDIYGGTCEVLIGPPAWSHCVKGNTADEKHPTREQALYAARNPATHPDVLKRLAAYDAELYREIRTAARQNPNYQPR